MPLVQKPRFATVQQDSQEELFYIIETISNVFYTELQFDGKGENRLLYNERDRCTRDFGQMLQDQANPADPDGRIRRKGRLHVEGLSPGTGRSPAPGRRTTTGLRRWLSSRSKYKTFSITDRNVCTDKYR